MNELFQKLITPGNEILILALLIILGLVFSKIAVFLRLPQITGYIVAGIVIGNPVLHLISPRNFESLQNINLVALGLMSITIGAHLNFYKLKNTGKRVIGVLLGETILSFTLVYFALRMLTEKDQLLSFLIASIAIATAPAATVAIVKESRAKGLVVNTLMPVVAINNVICIVVFGIVADVISLNGSGTASLLGLLSLFGKEIGIAVIIGVTGGYLLKFFSEKNIESGGQVLTLVFLTVLAATGLSQLLHINSMLPCMVIGIVITNTSIYKGVILSIFEEIEYLIMIIFFALAGAHIDISNLGAAGFVGFIYFFARGIGKFAGGTLGAYLARAPKTVIKNIGFTLLPQAGVAIGLVILAGGIKSLEGEIDFITTLVLAVVALNEIIGPPLARTGLIKSGDAGQDRPKLIEFLLEDYIKPSLKAQTKDEAIREVIDFFIKSHGGNRELEKTILKSVLEREKEGSTGIGHGVAIPHGVVEEGPVIMGVLGLSKEGIDFNSIDGEPVHLIILIITPAHHKADMHLSVLSEISKILSDNSTLKRVFASDTAAEICEIISEKENKNFNYFLD